MKCVVGLMLVDAPHSALNNAGMEPGERTENIVRTKVIRKGRETYPYVSGQAVRYWWRTTLGERFKWNLSPLVREEKIVFSEANPLEYEDDDVFGYMRAPKGKGSETVTRLSPLKVSPLISVIPTLPTQDYGTASRQDGDPVPYEHEFYSAILKGIFSLDVGRVGVFTSINRSGYKNLTKVIEKAAQERGLVRSEEGWHLDLDERKRRIRDTLGALPYIFGGAMSARHLTDVTPKLLLLALIEGGNHPLMNVVYGVEGRVMLDMNALDQILNDYRSSFVAPLHIGRRAGFMEEIERELTPEIVSKNGIVCGSINDIVDKFSSAVVNMMK